MDLETYSTVEIGRSGVYPYAEDPAFHILLIAYSVDGGAVKQADLAHGEEMPAEVTAALEDDGVLKWAFNAAFERVCLSRWCRDHGKLKDGEYLDPKSWRCTMVLGATLGLPLSLNGVGSVLQLEQQKLKEGKELIRRFCRPEIKPKAGDGTEWALFKRYNRRDVETETEIHRRLERFSPPEWIWEEYAMDQRINDRGVRIDRKLAEAAIRMDEKARGALTERMREMTGLENPGSVTQLKKWLAFQGIETDTLGKRQIDKLMTENSSQQKQILQEVLRTRKQLAKSSVKKYQAMQDAACRDGRARGCFQFYGANRTGRFSGRLIQLQNLPQNHMEDLANARELVRSGNYDAVVKRYGDVPDTLSQLIRTALIPTEGKKFIVADFSAIEARVLAWLAGETWRMNVFEQGGDIYSASASAMFHVPVEKHGVNSDLRQKGKIAELALGYGGAAGALKAMGATEMGIPENELGELVLAWRTANPRIVRFWKETDQAVKLAIREKTTVRMLTRAGVELIFQYQAGVFFIGLPSGRKLAYLQPRIEGGDFGGPTVTYMGVNAVKKWERLASYGPKFVENIVQGISRDLLCHAMRKVEERGDVRIVGHVHDEVITESPAELPAEAVSTRMNDAPDWAPGLQLRADGYECPAFYEKK